LRNRHFLFILAAAILGHTPLFVFGITGHSMLTNALWWTGFYDSLASGSYLPRWILNANAGCGAPVFFFYPPFPYYLPSAFHWLAVGQVPLIMSYITVYTLAIAAFYGWAARNWGPRAATFATIVYMTSPYIFIDIYIRDAFTEFFTFLFLPLLLRFTEDIIEGRREAPYMFAVFYGLLILSTPHGTLVGSALILGYALFLFWQKRSLQYFPAMALASTLGISLVSFYIVPLVLKIGDVGLGSSDGAFGGWFSYANRFALNDIFIRATGGALDPALSTAHEFDNRVFAFAAIPFLILSSLAVAQALRGKWMLGDRRALFWFWAAIASLFMMTPLSSPVLHILPALKYLQFPWRFATVTTIATAVVAAQVQIGSKSVNIRPQFIFVVLALLLLLSAGMARQVKIENSSRQDAFDEQLKLGIAPPPNEYLPSTASRDWLLADGSLTAYEICSVKKVSLLTGKANFIDVKEWRPGTIRATVDLAETSTLLVGQFNFPGWVAEDGQGNAMATETTPEGLIAISLPRGQHDITLRLRASNPETYSAMVSVFSFMLCMLGLARSRKFRPAANS